MPEKRTIAKSKELKREGKSPTTQAGPFVEEEMEHIRRHKHGARSTRQAIAIGLSKAREAGVDLPPPKKGRVKPRTRKSAEYAYERGHGRRKATHSSKRSRAVSRALKREGHSAASKKALSRQAHNAAVRRRKSGKTTSSRRRSA